MNMARDAGRGKSVGLLLTRVAKQPTLAISTEAPYSLFYFYLETKYIFLLSDNTTGSTANHFKFKGELYEAPYLLFCFVFLFLSPITLLVQLQIICEFKDELYEAPYFFYIFYIYIVLVSDNTTGSTANHFVFNDGFYEAPHTFLN